MSVAEPVDQGTTRLFETVVSGGYCIGCGACAALEGSPVTIRLDDCGQYCAAANVNASPLAGGSPPLEAVCPFSDQSLSEDEIARDLFGRNNDLHPLIGYHIRTFAGYVAEGDFRQRGSSGGLGTWIAHELFQQGLIDGVIHVHARTPTMDDPRLFAFQLSTTPESILSGAKSRYYPIEMSAVVRLVRARPGTYAFVGIPCFVKAMRLLSRQDPVVAGRVRFCIGLVCGHLKGAQYGQMLAWQCGVKPGDMLAIDFRKKLPGREASRYGVEVIVRTDGERRTISQPVHDLYGSDWGMGFFKYRACEFCDDVMAETADVVVGDAWLPQYLSDSQGTNVLVVRSPAIADLIEQAAAKERLRLEPVSADDVAASQAGGFRDRREGLARRLHLVDASGKWRPPKRVQPAWNDADQALNKKIQLRMALAAQSHRAFKAAVEAGDFGVFVRTMAPLVLQYQALYRPPLWKRVASRIKQALFRRKRQERP